MKRELIITLFLVLSIAFSSVSPNEGKSVVLEVPYVNQRYDVPEWFDGRYSCGPTSVVMVLAYYGVLPLWPINCTKPFLHTSLYRQYIVCKFKVRDFIFDEKKPDASREHFGYGVYGYVYTPEVGAVWSKMVKVFEIFGFKAYVDTTPTWEELVAEINAGRPVILSTQLTSSGHIVVAVGYTSDRGVIVNDPAGDKRMSYFNYNGAKVVYDWPSVNNGRVNLVKVKAFIIVRPTEKLKKAEPFNPCKPEEVISLEAKIIYSLLFFALIVALIATAIIYKKVFLKKKLINVLLVLAGVFSCARFSDGARGLY